MIAQIFFLNNKQRKICDTVASMLRDIVYKDIDVEYLGIDENHSIVSSFEAHRNFELYLYLFKRAVIKVNDFGLVIKDNKLTNYCYVGLLGGYHSRYHNWYNENYLEIMHKQLNSAFPAIAVMNRIVMLPRSITEAFDKHPRTFSWCPKPLDLGGVVLVDFEEKESIRKAIQQAGARLKDEISKLCSRHMLVRGDKKPDFEDLGRLLNIKTEFFKQFQKEIVHATSNLNVKVVSGPVNLGKKSIVTIEIRNESESILNNVTIRIRAPENTLKSSVSKTINSLSNQSAVVKISFDVYTKVDPYCPIEVLFELDYEGEVITPFPIPVILDVLAYNEQ